MKTLILLISFASNSLIWGQINKMSKEKSLNIDFSFPYSEINYCSFNNFIVNNETLIENIEILKLKNELIKSNFLVLKNYLKIKSKLNFIWNGEKCFLINYSTFTENEEKLNLIYCSDSKLDISKLKFILKLSNNSFWQFYNSDNNLNYPEINNLKSSVKDADDVLNLFKLAEVIEKNKSILSKYLDN